MRKYIHWQAKFLGSICCTWEMYRCCFRLALFSFCLIIVQFHYFSLPHTLQLRGLANHFNEFRKQPQIPAQAASTIMNTLVSFLNLFLDDPNCTKINIFSVLLTFSSSTFLNIVQPIIFRFHTCCTFGVW